MNITQIVQKAWPILLSVFMIMVGYGVLMPILPFYTERLSAGGLSEKTISFHIGLFAKVCSSCNVSGGTLPSKLTDLSSSFGFNPRLITLFKSKTFLREIFISIFTDSFMPGILNIVSYTLATSFVVSISTVLNCLKFGQQK